MAPKNIYNRRQEFIYHIYAHTPFHKVTKPLKKKNSHRTPLHT